MIQNPTIEDLTFQGKTISFKVTGGTVLASENSVSNEFRVSGGGGYVPSSGGYVSAPQVHTTTTHSQELWIRTKEGVDKVFEFQGTKVPVLAGQSVWVITGTLGPLTGNVPTLMIKNSSQTRHELAGASTLLDPLIAKRWFAQMLALWTIALVYGVLAMIVCPGLLNSGGGTISYKDVWKEPLGKAIEFSACGLLLVTFLYTFYANWIAFPKRTSAAKQRLMDYLEKQISQFHGA